ncbi:MAG: hypothetical protein ACRYFS_03600 [Janthinobacterium lividum]
MNQTTETTTITLKQKKSAEGCLVYLFLLPLIYFIRGQAFHALWLWFIVRQFHLSPISRMEAIGLMLLISFFVPTSRNSQEWDWERGVSLAIAVPLTLWLFGYIVHFWVY